MKKVAIEGIVVQLIVGFFLLLCGIGIYLLFRSETINLCQWGSTIGCLETLSVVRNCAQQWNVPEFVRYSLPDGLYCASYILLMDAVWCESKKIPRMVMVSAIPFIAINHELLQGVGLVKGTFDWCDLLAYLLPLAVYLLIMRNK